MTTLRTDELSTQPPGSVEFRALHEDETEECLRLWLRVFQRTSRDYFIPYFHGDPAFMHEYTRVCSAEGRLVSSVHICRREVRAGQTCMVAGGVANVATDPECRCRGYSTRLLQDAVEVMNAQGMDCSILFTGIQKFYERVGWSSVPVKMLSGTVRSDIPDPSDSVYSVRTCEWPYDIATIQLIHDAFNKDRSLTVVRGSDYWKGYALPRFGGPKSTLLAGKGGRVVGYLFYECEGEHCWLREVGYLPDDEVCVEVLLQTAAIRAREGGAQFIHSHLPAECILVQGFTGIADHVKVDEQTGMMCRLVNIESLARKILPELNRRARLHKPPSGSIRLQTELGSIDITVRFNHVSLGAHSPQEIALGQSGFFTLLFGTKSLKELDLDLSPRSRDILNALFPRQRAVYWEPDGF